MSTTPLWGWIFQKGDLVRLVFSTVCWSAYFVLAGTALRGGNETWGAILILSRIQVRSKNRLNMKWAFCTWRSVCCNFSNWINKRIVFASSNYILIGTAWSKFCSWSPISFGAIISLTSQRTLRTVHRKFGKSCKFKVTGKIGTIFVFICLKKC